MKAKNMVLNAWAGFLIAVLAAPACLRAAARPAVQPPPGLQQCSTQGALATGLARMASRFGAFGGCFVSADRVRVSGTSKSLELPVEFAFAFIIKNRAGASFATAEMDALYAKTQAQWRAVAKTWPGGEAAYEKQVQNLLRHGMAKGANALNLSITQPMLVSMRRLSPVAYVVVAIRRLNVASPVGAISSVKVVGNALVLENGKLIRLTIERELRRATDVRMLSKAINAWTATVEGPRSSDAR